MKHQDLYYWQFYRLLNFLVDKNGVQNMLKNKTTKIKKINKNFTAPCLIKIIMTFSNKRNHQFGNKTIKTMNYHWLLNNISTHGSRNLAGKSMRLKMRECGPSRKKIFITGIWFQFMLNIFTWLQMGSYLLFQKLWQRKRGRKMKLLSYKIKVINVLTLMIFYRMRQELQSCWFDFTFRTYTECQIVLWWRYIHR